MRKLFILLLLFTLTAGNEAYAGKKKKFKWYTVNVPEEGGISFQQITRDGSAIASPKIYMDGWYTGHMLSVDPSGDRIAYLDQKNGTFNVYLKSTNAVGSAVQRTFRAKVHSVCFSPDGKDLVFGETRDGSDAVYLISSEGGNIVRQIAAGYNPSFSTDGRLIFFTRDEQSRGGRGLATRINRTKTIWSYDTQTGMLSNYSNGNNPVPVPGEPDSFICERESELGYGEIWKINLKTGTEAMILSAPGHNYTSPAVSPDGKWILVVGNSSSNEKTLAYNPKSKKRYVFSTSKQNTDIYAIRIDGSELVQLTYHKGNDFCPTWSPDGETIYFLSQRGSESGDYNIWKMNFKVR